MVRVQKDYPYISDRAPAPVALKDHVSRISFCLCTCCPYLADIQNPHTNTQRHRQTHTNIQTHTERLRQTHKQYIHSYINTSMRCLCQKGPKQVTKAQALHCIYKYQYQYCFFWVYSQWVSPHQPGRRRGECGRRCLQSLGTSSEPPIHLVAAPGDAEIKQTGSCRKAVL